MVTIRNFSVAALTTNGFDYGSCTRRGKKEDVVAQAPVPKANEPRYDVVEKTIGQLRRDMERRRTTSQEITPFEHVANVAGNGHVAARTAPPLCGPGNGDHRHGKSDDRTCDDDHSKDNDGKR